MCAFTCTPDSMELCLSADVPDLNSCDARGFEQPGVTHERGQDAVRAGHGVRAVEDLRAHHRSARGRCGRSHAGLRRLFRVMAFAQLTWRESLRDIEVCLRQSSQAVPHGAEGAAGSLDAGRCAEPARLAHLPRAGAAADRARQSAVRPGLGARPRRQRLCAGRHHHRSVPEPVRVGAVSLDQGGHQAAHAAGPARRDPRVHPHQRRQAARCQRAGHPARRGRRLLRDGSRLPGLRAPVRDASGRRLLRHARQGGHGRPARVLGARRSHHAA